MRRFFVSCIAVIALFFVISPTVNADVLSFCKVGARVSAQSKIDYQNGQSSDDARSISVVSVLRSRIPRPDFDCRISETALL